MYMSDSHSQKFPSYNTARYAYAINLLSDVIEHSSHHETTCCEGWTVSDVIDHAEIVLAMVDNIDGESSISKNKRLTGELVEELKQGIEYRYTESILHKKVKSPFGEMTVDEFLGIIWIDTFTHVWDIADASNIDHGIPSDMAIEAYQIMEPRSESMRGPGRFGEPHNTTSIDPVERFIAFSGRKSVRN